jgi:hypothetical protein
LPTTLPLARFYEELVKTQQVLNHKHLGWRGLRAASTTALRLLARGQTNFLRMLWRWNSVFNSRRQVADHDRPVTYQMRIPTAAAPKEELYVLRPPPRTAEAG